MSGLGTGRCGFSGCENPCPRDEDFCCTGCEEATVREDEDSALGFVSFGLKPEPSTRDRILSLQRYDGAFVRVADVLALFDPGCSLCEQGHVPARPCATTDNDFVTVHEMGSMAPAGPTYPYTSWNEDAGVWVEWESEGIGRVVPAPEDDELGDVPF